MCATKRRVNSRSKGKRGEREIITLIQPIVSSVYLSLDLDPPILERNLMQSARGGFDIEGLDWIAIEVKRQEKFEIAKWWQQTIKQAGDDREPVLIYRKNHVPWRAVMYGILDAKSKDILAPVNVAYDVFEAWFRARLIAEITNEAVTA